jgi:hypothetical protein
MNEIIAAIVGAVVTGIIALIAYLYRSRQGNRIIVKRISETPQIDVSRRVKRKLEITYDGRPVENLVLNTLVIYNNGNEIIEPIEIGVGITLPDQTSSYLEVEIDDPLGETEIDMNRVGFTVSRPYLNPKKKFKEEEIKIAVFTSISLDFFVEGGGKGWYAEYKDEKGKAGGVRGTWLYLFTTIFVIILSVVGMAILSALGFETITIFLGMAGIILGVSLSILTYMSTR